MNNMLVLSLPLSLEKYTRVNWCLWGEAGELLQSGQSALDDINDLVSAYSDSKKFDVVGLLPGESVSLFEIDVPTRQLGKIRQAAPFLVEELIADDIEDVHIAVSENVLKDDAAVPVAIVRHKLLIEWLDVLYQSDLQPSVMTADTLVAPLDPHKPTLFFIGNEIIYRESDYQCAKLSLQDSDLILTSRGEGQKDLMAGADFLLVYSIKDELAESGYKWFREQYDDRYHFESVVYEESPIDILANRVISKPVPINFLQGGYKVRTEQNRQWLYGQGMAAAAVLFFLLQVAVTSVSGLVFNHHADRYDMKVERLYRSIFPNESRVVNPKRQMENKLRQLSGHGSSDQFIDILHGMSSVTSRFFLSNANFKINQINYSIDKAALFMELQCQSIEQLETFQQSVSEAGLVVNIQSANSLDDFVVGRVEIAKQVQTSG